MVRVKKTKIIPIILLTVGFSLFALMIVQLVVGSYEYNSKYSSYWELADRSSTLEAKEQYISKFVDAIKADRNKFADYNAIIFKTQQNKFDKNLEAIETLKQRLNEINKMNVTDFSYQIAIQQITEQEQGGAQSMLSDIKGCFFLRNYPLAWDAYSLIIIIMSAILIVVGVKIKYDVKCDINYNIMDNIW